MTGRIPQDFINELIARSDIVEIINTKVQLRHKGRNYSACCPFHNEKTPSFSVSPEKQFYYCFGCGAHGNVIGFLMEYERMDFLEAIEVLAQHCGIEVPKVVGQQSNQQTHHKQFYQILEQASSYYQTQLRQHSAAKNAVNYLKNRGVSGYIAKQYAIGFAPPGWKNLLQHLQQIDKTLLETSGMVIKKNEQRYYDRFRDRIMFPIRNTRGRIIGFGGRVLDDSNPKYLNSPETPIYHKGEELYGLYEALQIQHKLNNILLVEGYMDVIALAQYGINNACATLGTATSRKHLERLFRYTDEVIFCFDGDNAGKEAAWRALETCLPLMQDGRQTRFMFLPQGHDPDSFVRQVDKQKFEQAMQVADTLSQFFFKKLVEKYPADTLDGKARLAKHAMPLLEKMPGGLLQQMMLETLARTLRMDINKLTSMIKTSENLAQTKQESFSSHHAPSPLRLVITLLIQHPSLHQEITDPQFLQTLNIPGVDLLQKILKLLKEHPNLTTGAILEHWRQDPEAAVLAKLAATEHMIPEDGFRAEFCGALQRLHQLQEEQKMEQLLVKASQTTLSQLEKQQLQDLIRASKSGITKGD